MKSGRKGNRFLSRRSIEENGVPARASSFPRAKKKNARETFVERNSRALFEVVGRRGLEPRTNCLKGNCSTIELASRPKLFAETKSEEEDAFFPRGKQAFFFSPETEIFRERSRGDKNAPAANSRGSVFFLFSPKRKTMRKKSGSAAAPSARAGTSSAGKPSRRRRSALRSALRCSHRRARADPSSLPRRGRESNNNSA